MEKKREKAKQVTKNPANQSNNTPVRPVKYLEEYKNLRTFEMLPLTESVLERMGRELLQWAQDDETALRVDQFCDKANISTHTFREWHRKYPIFNEYYQEAKHCIGRRRETKGKDLPILPGMLERSMPMYDAGGPENWKELYEWRAGLNAKASGKNENQRIVVELAQIPDSTLVPKKKESE